MVKQEKTQIPNPNPEIDWAKMTELQNAASEYTEAKLKKALFFNLKDVVRRAKITEVHEVYDEDLGTIQYHRLSWDEFNSFIEKTKMETMSNSDKSVYILAKQLVPATPDTSIDETVQDLRKIPFEVVTRLLTKLQGEGSFFQLKPQAAPQLQTSKNGSTSASKPKTSG